MTPEVKHDTEACLAESRNVTQSVTKTQVLHLTNFNAARDSRPHMLHMTTN